MEHGLFIVSAPSGAGKTSLVQALVEKSEAVGVVAAGEQFADEQR